MPDQKDVVVIEAARLQRNRLGAALLYGGADQRRTVTGYTRRLVASVIVAAVVCAGSVGVSFVADLLAQRSAASVTSSSGAS